MSARPKRRVSNIRRKSAHTVQLKSPKSKPKKESPSKEPDVPLGLGAKSDEDASLIDTERVLKASEDGDTFHDGETFEEDEYEDNPWR